jgi:hypothetical protein
MSLQSQQLVSCDGIPNLAGAIVTASDEFVAGFVESTVGEGEDVGTQDLEEKEVGGFVALQLLD